MIRKQVKINPVFRMVVTLAGGGEGGGTDREMVAGGEDNHIGRRSYCRMF